MTYIGSQGELLIFQTFILLRSYLFYLKESIDIVHSTGGGFARRYHFFFVYTRLWLETYWISSAFPLGYFYTSIFICALKVTRSYSSGCVDLLEDPTQQIVNGSFFILFYFLFHALAEQLGQMNLLVVLWDLLSIPHLKQNTFNRTASKISLNLAGWIELLIHLNQCTSVVSEFKFQATGKCIHDR